VTGTEAASQSGAPPDTRAPRRPRTPWRAAFFALAGLGIIAGVAWALLGSRLLVVRSISVTGTHLVTRAQVLDAADVPLGTPLMRVNTAQVAQRIEAIRQVASATVSKDWPDHLAITVRERVPVVAVRMAGGGYDLVDPSGVIVRWSAARPAALPVFLTSVPGGALRGSPAIAQTSAVLAELPTWLFNSVAEVAAAGESAGAGADEQVTLYLRDHETVVWGGPDNAADKARELAILMRAPGTYFDVSAPGTAVTRLQASWRASSTRGRVACVLS
jgi:cell division protein FtsQ